MLHGWLRRFELGELHGKTSGLTVEEGASGEAWDYRTGITAQRRLRWIRAGAIEEAVGVGAPLVG